MHEEIGQEERKKYLRVEKENNGPFRWYCFMLCHLIVKLDKEKGKRKNEKKKKKNSVQCS